MTTRERSKRNFQSRDKMFFLSLLRAQRLRSNSMDRRRQDMEARVVGVEPLKA